MEPGLFRRETSQVLHFHLKYLTMVTGDSAPIIGQMVKVLLLPEPSVYMLFLLPIFSSHLSTCVGCVIGIDTNIEVIVVSLLEGEARGLWWASQVVNETTMTEIEVSISILSWWNQINNE